MLVLHGTSGESKLCRLTKLSFGIDMLLRTFAGCFVYVQSLTMRNY